MTTLSEFMKEEPEQQTVPEQLKMSDFMKPQGLQRNQEESGLSGLKNIGANIADLFTGESKQTEFTKGPQFELDFLPPRALENLSSQNPTLGDLVQRQKKGFSAALGMLTTFSPDKQAQTLKANFPGLKFFKDEKGNIIVDGRAEGGNVGPLNLPGLDARDLLQVGFQIAAFSPAAKTAGLVTGIGKKSAAVGGASGITQVAQDITSQATRGDVSLSKVDVPDVIMATLGGAGAEAFFSAFKSMVPILKEGRGPIAGIDELGNVTNEARKEFRKVAVEFNINPDEISDKVIRAHLVAVKKSIKPGDAGKLLGEEEFDTPLSLGQRTGDQAQLSFEDSARVGIFGSKAKKQLLDFEDLQNKQSSLAKDRVQGSLGQRVTSQRDAGDLIRQDIVSAEKAADTAVGEAFDEVGNASLSSEGVKGLFKSTSNALKGVEFDKTLRETNKILKLAKSASRLLNKKGIKAKSIHINQLENMRRRLNTAFSAAENSADRRQVRIIKSQWDDYMDNAVKNALFEGDQEAMGALKNSRSLFAEYAQKFRSQPTRLKSGKVVADKEGTFIEKIISSNPTDEQIINAVFGASNFSNIAGKNMASKFKAILGKDSEGWNAIRQAGFMRLIKENNGIISGQQTLKAINIAMGKNGSLMDEIFTKAEIGLFKRFAAQVKRTQPFLVRSRENPSGTAQKLIKGMKETLVQTMRVMGFASGNPAMVISSTGIEIGSGFRSAARARKAVKPFKDVIDVRPTPVAAVTQGTVDFGN